MCAKIKKNNSGAKKLNLTDTGIGGYIYDYKTFTINVLEYVMAFVQIRSFQAPRLHRCHLRIQNLSPDV